MPWWTEFFGACAQLLMVRAFDPQMMADEIVGKMAQLIREDQNALHSGAKQQLNK